MLFLILSVLRTIVLKNVLYLDYKICIFGQLDLYFHITGLAPLHRPHFHAHSCIPIRMLVRLQKWGACTWNMHLLDSIEVLNHLIIPHPLVCEFVGGPTAIAFAC